MFTGSVHTSARYIWTGSAMRAPPGDVGECGYQASMPASQSASKSRLISVRTFWALR